MTFAPATDSTNALRQRLSKASTAALARPLVDSAVRLLDETAGIKSTSFARVVASSASSA